MQTIKHADGAVSFVGSDAPQTALGQYRAFLDFRMANEIRPMIQRAKTSREKAERDVCLVRAKVLLIDIGKKLKNVERMTSQRREQR